MVGLLISGPSLESLKPGDILGSGYDPIRPAFTAANKAGTLTGRTGPSGFLLSLTKP
jgi:hypothetical protein